MAARQAFTQAMMKCGEMDIETAFSLMREFPEYRDVEGEEWKKSRPALLMALLREIQTNVEEFGFTLDIVKNPLNDDERCLVWSSKGDSTALQDTSGLLDGSSDTMVVQFMREFVSSLFERQLVGGLDDKGVYVEARDLKMLMARVDKVNQTNTAISLMVEEQWLKPADDQKKYYCTMRFYQEFNGYLELDRPEDEMNERLEWAKVKSGR